MTHSLITPKTPTALADAPKTPINEPTAPLAVPLRWVHFDADSPDPYIDSQMTRLSETILNDKKVDKNNCTAVRSFAEAGIDNYISGSNPELNKTVGVHIFRPQEFAADSSNEESLAELRSWFFLQSFNWLEGSKTVQRSIDSTFKSGGSKRIKGGRESVILDNLVIIKTRTVAIEIETSTNVDNGYWTLRQAIRSRRADYGVMIVPWTAEGQGRANEGMAMGRLDREFDGATNMKDGPIYRIAIIRLLDVYRLMLKDRTKVHQF